MKIPANSAQPGPPPMEEILGLGEPVADELYNLGTLLGIKGTWHRLWGALLIHWSFLGPLPKLVDELRDEFEEHLGRPMHQAEWSQLNARASALVQSE